MSEKSLAGFPARRKARKRAVDILYEAEQRDEPIERILQARCRLAMRDPQMPGVPEYTMTLVDGVADHLDPIDEAITGCLEGWELGRIPAVDRNILRVAAYELLFGEETIDTAVVISEAVKIADVLCGDDSPAFINGVLDGIARIDGHAR